MANGEIPSAKDVLIAARKLIEKPEDWWPGVGRATPYHRYGPCAANAICQVGNLYEHCERPIELLAAAMNGESFDRYRALPTIFKFNDTHTHAEVLDAFSRAIAACDEAAS